LLIHDLLRFLRSREKRTDDKIVNAKIVKSTIVTDFGKIESVLDAMRKGRLRFYIQDLRLTEPKDVTLSNVCDTHIEDRGIFLSRDKDVEIFW
jgi:hypothetical protein